MSKVKVLLNAGFGRYVDNKLRETFFRWKHTTDICHHREKKMRAVFKKISSRDYRAYFTRWKMNAFADNVML